MSCGPLQFVCDAVGGAVGSAGGAVASAGFGMIAKSFASAAQTMCDWMWSAISATTQVRLDGDWFGADLAITGEIAGVMVTALFVLQLIKGAIRRDPHALARALTGCGMAFLGAAGAVLVTGTLLVLADELSDGIVHTVGMGDLAAMGRRLTPLATLSAGDPTPALVIVISIFFVIGSVLVWAVFLIRKALIIVAVIFAPVAFGGATHDATRGWVRKWVEFTLAMIFSKVIIVVIFTIALSLIGSTDGGTQGLSGLMTGLLLLVLACFAPWLVFKLVHFVGGDLIAAHHGGTISDVKAAGATATGAVASMRSTATKVFASSPTATASSASAATQPSAAAIPAAAAVPAGLAARGPAAAGRGTAALIDGASPPPTQPPTPAHPGGDTQSPPGQGRQDPSMRPTRLSRHGVNWGDAT